MPRYGVYHFAQTYMAVQQYDIAVSVCATGIEWKPDSMRLYGLRGNAYMEVGRIKRMAHGSFLCALTDYNVIVGTQRSQGWRSVLCARLRMLVSWKKTRSYRRLFARDCSWF